MAERVVWKVEIDFVEDEDRTRADAKLETGTGVLHISGWGRAKRAPGDPDIPEVGELLAAARALADLSNHLLYQAAHEIENTQARLEEDAAAAM